MLALLLPLFALAFITTRKRKLAVRPVLWFVILFVFSIACVFSYQLVEFIPAWGKWNWQGKVLGAVWPVALALLVPRAFAAKRVGFTLPAHARHWRTLWIVCVLYACAFIVVMLLSGAHFGMYGNLPSLVYEATLPGLAEEFVYRGVLLMLLDEAFGRPWKFAGIGFGWGFIIVTVLFGLIHGVDAESLGHIRIAWVAMLFPVVIGAVLAWLRERTDSVWPGVVFHNFVDVLSQFVA